MSDEWRRRVVPGGFGPARPDGEAPSVGIRRLQRARWQRAMDEARHQHSRGLGPSVPDLDPREVCRPCARVGPIHQRADTRWRRLLHWAGWWP